ncbi:MAG TPA: OsmC family protein, partial [Polyangiaceae bacterium]
SSRERCYGFGQKGSTTLVRIEIGYDGDLHCHAVHAPSATRLETDAPVDNQGRGESFSPTDLLATALGTCMATTMGIRARERGYDITGMHLSVDKLMTPPPRRVARLVVNLTLPRERAARLDAQARAELEERGDNCPVRLSLLPAVEVPVRYDWDGEGTSTP